MRQVSVSLFTHYDKGSIFSHATDMLSRLSIVFDFDSTLLQSSPYQLAMRFINERLVAPFKDTEQEFK
jgi:hypothetical protein